jgi:hypothetical protein
MLLRTLVFVILGTLLTFVLPNCRAVEPATTDKAAEECSATIKDNVVRLQPGGATFEIPQSWLQWHAGFKNNLRLTRAELDKVKTAEGDWDKEYSVIVNKLLPFSQCAAHVGSEGWGSEAVSYGDLQMRAYIMETSAEKVQAKLVEHGKAWVSKFSDKATVEQAKSGKWLRATLSYDMWYGDYGAKAIIDVYSQDFGTQTAVLVFMHTDFKGASGPIPEILKSFTWTR